MNMTEKNLTMIMDLYELTMANGIFMIFSSVNDLRSGTKISLPYILLFAMGPRKGGSAAKAL